jgi:hypothetical protein
VALGRLCVGVVPAPVGRVAGRKSKSASYRPSEGEILGEVLVGRELNAALGIGVVADRPDCEAVSPAGRFSTMYLP